MTVTYVHMFVLHCKTLYFMCYLSVRQNKCLKRTLTRTLKSLQKSNMNMSISQRVAEKHVNDIRSIRIIPLVETECEGHKNKTSFVAKPL